jgi:hypothetical protein
MRTIKWYMPFQKNTYWKTFVDFADISVETYPFAAIKKTSAISKFTQKELLKLCH